MISFRIGSQVVIKQSLRIHLYRIVVDWYQLNASFKCIQGISAGWWFEPENNESQLGWLFPIYPKIWNMVQSPPTSQESTILLGENLTPILLGASTPGDQDAVDGCMNLTQHHQWILDSYGFLVYKNGHKKHLRKGMPSLPGLSILTPRARNCQSCLVKGQASDEKHWPMAYGYCIFLMNRSL